MNTSPVRKQLALSLQNLRPDLRESWLPELVGEALRDDMMANPRLHDRIVADLCPDAPQGTDEPEGEIHAPDLLSMVFEIGFEQTVKLIGAALNSNNLAGLVTSSALASRLPEVSLAEVKASLRYRELAPAASGETVMTFETLIDDGKACLAGWLQRQSTEIQTRLSYLWDLPHAGAEGTDRQVRCDLTEAVLRDLAA